MNIEAIFVGSELLRGKLNLNLSIISKYLSTIGLKLKRAITVPDDDKEIEKSVKEAISNSDIVFVVGGFGPTFDDRTLPVISRVLKKKVVFSRDVMHMIAAYFARKGRDVPKGAERQAYIISGAKILKNSRGVAPGEIIELKSKNKIVILLPGPPNEVSGIFEEELLPYLKERFERGISRRVVYHLAGITEMEIEKEINEIRSREFEGGNVEFSILPCVGGVDIEVYVDGEDELVVREIIKRIELELNDFLGDKIFGKDDETLPQVIGRLLAGKRSTLSIAESCTGGLIQDMITDVSGSSIYFKGGLVVYSVESKIKNLGVNEEIIKKYSAVSKECAIEMLKGLRRIFKTDFTVSTTGIAGPTGGSKEKPVGLVFIGCGKGDDFKVKKYIFTGSRRIIKEKAAKYALEFLRRRIIGME